MRMELDSLRLAERGFSCPRQGLPSYLPKREFLASFLLTLILGRILLQNLLEAGTLEPDTLAGFPERAMAFLSARSLLLFFLPPGILFMHKQLHSTLAPHTHPFFWLISDYLLGSKLALLLRSLL